MSDYIITRNNHSGPSYNVREEQILDHFFMSIGNGLDWVDGQLQEDNGHEYKNKDDSISKEAHSQAIYGEKEFDPEKASYWFDYFFLKYNLMKLIPVTKHFYPSCVKYNNLCNIPDDIKDDWAAACIKCCNWLDSITLDDMIALEFDESIKMFVSHDDNKYINEAWIYYPELKVFYDNYKERTKGLDFLDKMDDPDYKTINSNWKIIYNKARELAKEPVLKYLNNKFNTKNEIVSICRTRLKELGKDNLDPGQLIFFNFDESLPDWYISNKDRKDDSNKIDNKLKSEIGLFESVLTYIKYYNISESCFDEILRKLP